jgi:hypothetical protein
METANEASFWTVSTSAHSCSQLESDDIKRDMSHTVTAEIIKTYYFQTRN